MAERTRPVEVYGPTFSNDSEGRVAANPILSAMNKRTRAEAAAIILSQQDEYGDQQATSQVPYGSPSGQSAEYDYQGGPRAQPPRQPGGLLYRGTYANIDGQDVGYDYQTMRNGRGDEQIVHRTTHLSPKDSYALKYDNFDNAETGRTLREIAQSSLDSTTSRMLQLEKKGFGLTTSEQLQYLQLNGRRNSELGKVEQIDRQLRYVTPFKDWSPAEWKRTNDAALMTLGALGGSAAPGRASFNSSSKNIGFVNEKTVLATAGIEEQSIHAAAMIPGLSDIQAKALLHAAFNPNKSVTVVIGGSRVRSYFGEGNFRPDSDLDIGFDAKMKNKQIDTILNAFDDAGALRSERSIRIFSGNNPPSGLINSPQEFFQRSGIREMPPERYGEAFNALGISRFIPTEQ